MNPRTQIPQNVSQLAHSAAADVRKVTTTLTGYSTPQALSSAELALDRAIDNLRVLKVHVRTLKAKSSAPIVRVDPAMVSAVMDEAGYR